MRPSCWLFGMAASAVLAACLHDYDRFELDGPGGASGASSAGSDVGGSNVGGSDTGAGHPPTHAGEGGQDSAKAGSPSGGALSEPSAGAPAMCEGGATRCDAACTDLDQDPSHCGSCDVACSPQNVAVSRCQAGSCAPVCAAGFADCAPGGMSDDGCELDVSANDASCGSCSNDCSAQGNGAGLSCAGSLCGCTSNAQCDAGGLGSGTCDTDSRICSCGGVACVAGEACLQSGLNQICACNGGSACQAGHTCCESPAGCKDLSLDPASCGACGNACPTGTTCASGKCQ